ncbi:TPA: hypothetical protein DEP96_01565 [Candidatus Uhrbacteria bacterium]|nr:hypothetical protein [Candidatus Uhrbacteria bacterium]
MPTHSSPLPLDENPDDMLAPNGDDTEFDGDAEDEDSDIVTLMDADGNDQDFRFLGVISLEGDPDAGQFAALTPAEEDEDPDAPTEVFLFHYEADEDGGESFAPIDDEDLFARVQIAAEAHFAALDDDPEVDALAEQTELASIDDED